jgi:hypothetical protein
MCGRFQASPAPAGLLVAEAAAALGGSASIIADRNSRRGEPPARRERRGRLEAAGGEFIAENGGGAGVRSLVFSAFAPLHSLIGRIALRLHWHNI